MKLLRMEAEGLALFKEKIELDFFTDQRVVGDNNDGALDNLFGNVYTNNLISFVGINASGKTSILRVISMAIDILNGDSLNIQKNKMVLDGSEKVDITLYFYDGQDKIYKLNSIINKYDNSSIEKKYVFVSERMWEKRITTVRTKKQLLDFNNSADIVRNNNEKYLKDDISIAISVGNNNYIHVFDTLVLTDYNALLTGNYPKELITFLDSSIDYIKDAEKGIIVKFKGKDEIKISNPEFFKNYLSSGTIKGLSFFALAIVTFQNGGYLIMDEIENHFNKEIAATLMRFFMNKSTNPKGGTLIFSTHYHELLDEIDRNDSIYIMRNKGGLTSQRLSDVLKRNDLKKSEVFQSDFLEGTAPLYDAYLDLKHTIEEGIIMEG